MDQKSCNCSGNLIVMSCLKSIATTLVCVCVCVCECVSVCVSVCVQEDLLTELASVTVL